MIKSTIAKIIILILFLFIVFGCVTYKGNSQVDKFDEPESNTTITSNKETPVVEIVKSTDHEEASTEDQSNIHYTYNRLLQDMVYVHSGTFMMGSPESEIFRKEDELLHQVTLTRDFVISRYEVTQLLWSEVMGSLPRLSRAGNGDNYPVYNISLQQAAEFCNELSLLHGLDPAYYLDEDSFNWTGFSCNFDANGYRLPTEAEWEYAARGGHEMGEQTLFAGSNAIDGVAWYDTFDEARGHPVGTKSPNILGLYDMSGNVSEMCWDARHSDFYEDSIDPLCTIYNEEYVPASVIRGGNMISDPNNCRIAARGAFCFGERTYYAGFRLVKTVLPEVN